jgi:ribosomal protein S13
MTNHQDYQDTYPIEDEEIIAEMLRFNSKDPEVEYLNKEESDSLQEMLDNMYETEYRLVRRYFSDIKNEKSDLGNL